MGKGFGGIAIALLAAAALFAFSGLGKKREQEFSPPALGPTALPKPITSTRPTIIFGAGAPGGGITFGRRDALPIPPVPALTTRTTFTPSTRPIIPGVASSRGDAFTRPPVGSQVVVGASGTPRGFITPEGVQQRRTLDLVLTQTGISPFFGSQLGFGTALTILSETDQMAKDVLAAAARLELEILGK